MADEQKKPDDFAAITNKFLRRGISRRAFLGYTAAMGLSLPAVRDLMAALPNPPVKGMDGLFQGTSSAATAEKIMKDKYSGKTLTVVWESGLQAQDPINFTGPMLEKKTGVKLNVVEGSQGPELFSKQITEHTAGTGAFDVLNVQPAWMADMVYSGTIEPLDDFVKQY